MAIKVRGVVQPEREQRTVWIDRDQLETEPVSGHAGSDAELCVEGG